MENQILKELISNSEKGGLFYSGWYWFFGLWESDRIARVILPRPW
jgi:hypothetical protein